MWAVAPDETRWSGAAAINRALQQLDSVWAWMAALYRLAPLGWIEDRAHRWVAEHRTRLSRLLGTSPE